MTTPKELYWGDNDVHEFWESEDHELLILRNQSETSWTAHRNHGFLFGCLSATEEPHDSAQSCHLHGSGPAPIARTGLGHVTASPQPQ